MPMTRVVLFREADGSVPFLNWYARLQNKAKDQCRARLELLRAYGHQLRRPAAENLGGGIWELRAKSSGINYRMLYFFHGQDAIVVSHGFDKQRASVPLGEIEAAKARRKLYMADPETHTHEE